jgi:AAA+ superfamily predicted ATPase
MAGKYVLEKAHKVENFKVGDELLESDFSHFNNDTFYQWKYIPDKEEQDFLEITPGCWRFEHKESDIVLRKAHFTKNNKLLEEYIHTKNLTDKIDSFFNKLDVYKKYEVFPKRGILLHGPQGTGKSQIISKISETYLNDPNTAVLIWPTDKFKARDINYSLQVMKYTNVDKLILVIEDIGGVSVKTEGQQLAVEPSLLNLLDNTQDTFKIATLIIATTNFPENLLQNLSNRPQRFDYLYKVDNPSSEFRSKFLEFFSLNKASEEELKLIAHKKYDKFSVAHIKEVVIRSELHDISIKESMNELLKQSELSANQFQAEKNKVGIGSSFDDYE